MRRFTTIDNIIVSVKCCADCPFLWVEGDILTMCRYPIHNATIMGSDDIDNGFPKKCPLSHEFPEPLEKMLDEKLPMELK